VRLPCYWRRHTRAAARYLPRGFRGWSLRIPSCRVRACTLARSLALPLRLRVSCALALTQQRPADPRCARAQRLDPACACGQGRHARSGAARGIASRDGPPHVSWRRPPVAHLALKMPSLPRLGRRSQFVHELAPVEAESAPAEQDDVKVEAGAMLVSLTHKHTHAHTCLCVYAPVLGAATSRSCICLTLAIHAHITRSRLGARLQGARRGCCCARGLRVLRRPRPDIVHICAHAQTHTCTHAHVHCTCTHTQPPPPNPCAGPPLHARAALLLLPAAVVSRGGCWLAGRRTQRHRGRPGRTRAAWPRRVGRNLWRSQPASPVLEQAQAQC